MTTKLQWWLVGGLALALVLIGVVAFAARPTSTGASDGSSGDAGTGSDGSSEGSTAAPARCRVLADGSTVTQGQSLYSAGYTPLVGTPDQKAPILASRYRGERVGTFTGKTAIDTRYFADGTCFIQVQPYGGDGIVSDLPSTVWIHPKHVNAKSA